MTCLRFLALLILLYSLSIEVYGQKVIDRNQRKPKWVDNTPTDYVVACGESSSLEEAKKIAINNIREKIASAISSNVQSQFVQTTSETSSGSSRVWSEEINSTLNIESQLAGTLSGISESLAKDVFWEKLSSKKVISFRCCILYDFSKKTLQDFIEKNEINRIKIERKKNELISEYENCNSFSDLQKLKSQVKTQLSGNDPLYSKLLESFDLFLKKEIDGIKPAIDQIDAYSINIAFRTTSGKNILTNALYQLEGSILEKHSTAQNIDSILFINPFSEGVKTAKLTIEYSLTAKPKSEEIYFQPVSVKERIKLNSISTRSLDSEKLIHAQIDLLDKGTAILNAIIITGNGVNLELIPLEKSTPLKWGANTLELKSSNQESLNELKKKLNRYFDVKLIITNEKGITITKEVYSFLIN